MKNTFLTFTDDAFFSFREEGSEFLSYGFPCADAEIFEQRLASLRREHHTATHHCPARRINPSQPEDFASDDGEPSGTAGLPILNQMKSAGLCNCGIVVVRYYGGTKLGKPGLIRAYGNAASGVIEIARLSRITAGRSLTVTLPYSEKKQVDMLFDKHAAIIHDAVFTDRIAYKVHVPAESIAALEHALESLSWTGVKTESGSDIILSIPA